MLALPSGTPTDLLESPCVFSPDAGTLLCGSATCWLSLDVQTSEATLHADAPGVPLAWVGTAGS